MSDELLLRHCSPTVIGLKTANMFVCRFDSREQEHRTLQKLNKKLCSKGLRIIPLRHNEDKVLLYLYRPSKLKRDLEALNPIFVKDLTDGDFFLSKISVIMDS